MNSSSTTSAEQSAAQLHLRRQIILADIKEKLHSSDDPGKLSLVNHLEEVGDWVEADLLNDTDIALLGNELSELRDIDAAMLRIKTGAYGVCADCGEAISSDRMHAQITARLCIACQGAAEKRHGTGHGATL